RGVSAGRKRSALRAWPLGEIKCVKSLLPRDAVSVERGAEIEQQRFDRRFHCMARTLSRLTHNTRDSRAHEVPCCNCYERCGLDASLAPGSSSGRSNRRPSMKALHASYPTMLRNLRGGLLL